MLRNIFFTAAVAAIVARGAMMTAAMAGPSTGKQPALPTNAYPKEMRDVTYEQEPQLVAAGLSHDTSRTSQALTFAQLDLKKIQRCQA